MKKSVFLFLAILLGTASNFIQAKDNDEIKDNPLYNRSGFKPATNQIISVFNEGHETRNEKGVRKLFVASPKALNLQPGQRIQLQGIDTYPKELINDQGDIGSCTANAANACMKHESIRISSNPSNFRGNPEMLTTSRLFQYYVTRHYEGKLNNTPDTINQDTGASIIGALAAMDIYGATPEKISYQAIQINAPDLKGILSYNGWAYDTSKFTETPPPDAWRLAQDENILGINLGTSLIGARTTLNNPYTMVANNLQYKDLSSEFRGKGAGKLNSDTDKEAFLGYLQSALSRNHAIFAGIAGDDDTFRDHNGYFPAPNFKTFQSTCGHAFKVVGLGYYNKNNRQKLYAKIENSWGPNWGDSGFGYFEADHLAQLNSTAGEFFEVWINKPIK